MRTIRQSKVNQQTSNGNVIFEYQRQLEVVARLPAVGDTAIPEPPVAPVSTALSIIEPEEFEPLRGPSNITRRDFIVRRVLGQGASGRVFLVEHVATTHMCALKMIQRSQCNTREAISLIKQELEVHQNLRHGNILRLHGWFHDMNAIYLVLEHARGGTLLSHLHQQPNGRFDERTAAAYIAQLAKALRYLHTKRIIHRDVKPENILLGRHSEIKLADFGLSVHSECGYVTSLSGSLDYIAPEVAIASSKPENGEGIYTRGVDHWSLGIVMYELLVGKTPFHCRSWNKTKKKIAKYNGKGISFPRHVSKDARHLIRRLLARDAFERISFEHVLCHPWIVRLVDGQVGRV